MIVSYDPRAHGRFVFGAFCAGAAEPFDVLEELLATGARCAVRVAANVPGVYMAYAIATAEPQTVAWCYTKQRLRGNGLMVALLEHLGVDPNRSMRALFWSPACDTLINRGWPIVYDPGTVRPVNYEHPRPQEGAR